MFFDDRANAFKATDGPRNFNSPNIRSLGCWQTHNSHNFYFTSLGLKEGRRENKVRNNHSTKKRQMVKDRPSTQVKGFAPILEVEAKKKHFTKINTL